VQANHLFGFTKLRSASTGEATVPALIGTHTIGYRDLQGTCPCAAVAIPAEIEFTEESYTHSKRFGTDKWLLTVGETFDKLLRDGAAKGAPNPGIRVVIHGLEVTEFAKGLFQWSRHRIRIRFCYELWRGEVRLQSGLIEEEAEGSRMEFGFLTFIPVLGNLNFDKGIELALSRCLQNALQSLAGKIEGL
jgi:hypothetical protein